MKHLVYILICTTCLLNARGQSGMQIVLMNAAFDLNWENASLDESGNACTLASDSGLLSITTYADAAAAGSAITSLTGTPVSANGHTIQRLAGSAGGDTLYWAQGTRIYSVSSASANALPLAEALLRHGGAVLQSTPLPEVIPPPPPKKPLPAVASEPPIVTSPPLTLRLVSWADGKKRVEAVIECPTLNAGHLLHAELLVDEPARSLQLVPAIVSTDHTARFSFHEPMMGWQSEIYRLDIRDGDRVLMSKLVNRPRHIPK